MLRELFSKQKSPAENWPFCSRPVYAVGDVHGRMDLLVPLLETIQSDIAAEDLTSARPMIVFLGDYIDRGPSSRAVVDCILDLKRASNLEVRALKGNHEQALLLFLKDAQFGPTWMTHGGTTTLKSYGISPPNPRATIDVFESARGAFLDALGPRHLQFFENLELYLIQDHYAFVHAGIRWNVPLAQQAEQDLLWIRREFLDAEKTSAHVIVHGHTPAEKPYMGTSRIGIDTGAYATGVLSAVRLWNSSQRILQSR
jgi:serine/threonine protein phosphatase 1